MLPNTAGAAGVYRVNDIYPGLHRGPGATSPSVTNAASAPSSPLPAASPAVVLISIVVLLVVVRLVYEMAPAGGKGI